MLKKIRICLSIIRSSVSCTQHMGLWSKEQLRAFIKENNEVTAKMTPNTRNSKSKKIVVSEYGEQEITMPRDRMSEFEPIVVQNWARCYSNCLSFFQNGWAIIYVKSPNPPRGISLSFLTDPYFKLFAYPIKHI